MARIEVQGNRIISRFAEGERYKDWRLIAWAKAAGMGPAFYRGFAEGVRKREAFRARHGRLPRLDEDG